MRFGDQLKETRNAKLHGKHYISGTTVMTKFDSVEESFLDSSLTLGTHSKDHSSNESPALVYIWIMGNST